MTGPASANASAAASTSLAPASVVVLRFSSAGDVLLTSPALEALKTAWPSTRVRFVVKPAFADLVRHNPHVDEIVEMREGESARALARRIAAGEGGAAAVLDLHSGTRSRGVRFWLPRRGPRVVWTKRPLTDAVLVRLRVRPYRAAMTIADRYHAAVERLVGRALPKGSFRLWVSEADRAAAGQALTAAGVDATRPILGMSPGANWFTKRWPADRYADIARRAAERGMQVIATGSAGEAAILDEVRASAPHVIPLAGRLTLGQLGGVIERCAAFVANDSGPMHMARALGVPTLAFFGSTDPKQFDFTGHALRFAAVECSPCSFYGLSRCPKGHFRCLLDLDAASSWSALEPLLTRPRPPFPRG
ncbi:MAG TPA: glycosyltransferase family 9 protein [bacterium]|nr:glycosyltransferase family 9 protein [bacterium]